LPAHSDSTTGEHRAYIKHLSQESLMDPRTRTDVPPDAGKVEETEAEKADERLDEELEETFPASDPIPYRHDS
jgi:hypothetical protein